MSRRDVIWFPSNSGTFEEISARGNEIVDGRMVYRLFASDELTWLELTVRVQPGRVPQSHDLSLHTHLPGDIKGDRWLDWSSALMGGNFIGHIYELQTPSKSFWELMQKRHLEWDAEAREAYAKDKEATFAAALALGATTIEQHLPLKKTSLELDSVWRVVGAQGNIVVIAGPRGDVGAIMAAYRAHVDRIVGALGDQTAAKPVYDIETLDYVGPITIIP